MTWLIWLFAHNSQVFVTNFEIDDFVAEPLILPRNSEILCNSFIDKSHVLNAYNVNQLTLMQQKGTIHIA